MTYQVLARRWRPRTFAEMIGQQHVVRALVNALDGDRLHHAFLFAGTRGVGKTTIARILAKCMNCEEGVSSTPCGACASCREIDESRFVDLIEVDAASRAKVDETRELMDNVQYAPTRGRYKVYLIDEVHMFSTHSFNALLKTLEEPPPHVKFLLATTDPQKLPVTVLSRCLQFNLKRLPAGDIAGQLERILAEEQVGGDLSAVRLIASAADGSMRDALSLLDQALAYCGGNFEPTDVRAMLGTLERSYVQALLESVAAGDPEALMAHIDEMASEVTDFAEVLGELLMALKDIAVAQAVPEAVNGEEEEQEAVRRLAERVGPEDVQLFYQIGLIGRRDLPLAPDPRGGFEMVMLRMLAFRPVESARDLGKARTGVRHPAPRPAYQKDTVTPTGPASSQHSAAPVNSEAWPEIVNALALSGVARELAANTVFKEQLGAEIRLQLSPAHAQLAGDKAKEKLSRALSELWGQRVRVKIEIGDHEENTPAGLQRRESQARREAAIRSVEQDPNVKAMCETFGARIDKGSIRPVD